MKLKNKIYATVGGVLLLAVLLIVLVLSPLFGGITKNAAEFVKTKEKIALLDAEIANIENLKSQYQEYQKDLEKIDNLFINAEVPIDFIRFLEELSGSLNVSANIAPGSSLRGTSQEWQTLNFQISAESSFINFARFLEKLENAPYLIEVQNLTINAFGAAEGSQAGARRISASFTIKVFAK